MRNKKWQIHVVNGGNRTIVVVRAPAVFHARFSVPEIEPHDALSISRCDRTVARFNVPVTAKISGAILFPRRILDHAGQIKNEHLLRIVWRHLSIPADIAAVSAQRNRRGRLCRRRD